MGEILYKDESYKLVGLGMLVHRELGSGYLEAVYQEAFEIALKQENIPYDQYIFNALSDNHGRRRASQRRSKKGTRGYG